MVPRTVIKRWKKKSGKIWTIHTFHVAFITHCNILRCIFDVHSITKYIYKYNAQDWSAYEKIISTKNLASNYTNSECMYRNKHVDMNVFDTECGYKYCDVNFMHSAFRIFTAETKSLWAISCGSQPRLTHKYRQETRNSYIIYIQIEVRNVRVWRKIATKIFQDDTVWLLCR